MTGLVRKATLMSACGLLAAATAFANVPSPAFSTVPDVIRSYGRDGGGTPHTAASPISGAQRTFTIVVHDFTDNPVAGSLVELDFGACSDFKVCQDVIAGTGTAVCAGAGGTGTVTGTTNALGVFTATLLGGGIHNTTSPPPAGPLAGAKCIEVRADGVVIGNANLFEADNNGGIGGGGVTGVDLANAKIDAGQPGASHVGRSDFDGVGGITGVDLSELSIILGQGQSLVGCSSYCP